MLFSRIFFRFSDATKYDLFTLMSDWEEVTMLSNRRVWSSSQLNVYALYWVTGIVSKYWLCDDFTLRYDYYNKKSLLMVSGKHILPFVSHFKLPVLSAVSWSKRVAWLWDGMISFLLDYVINSFTRLSERQRTYWQIGLKTKAYRFKKVTILSSVWASHCSFALNCDIVKNGRTAFTTKWHLRPDTEKIDTEDGGQA